MPKRALLAFLCAGVASACFLGSLNGAPAAPEKAARIAPDLEVVTLDGRHLTSEELRGKVVLLDFWATWCAPCRAAIPDLLAMSRRLEPDPFVLISVSVDSNRRTLGKFVAKNKMTWPQVWDGKREIARQWKVDGFPSYLLIGPDGEILYSAQGWSPRSANELNLQILRALRDAKGAQKPG